MTNEVKSLFELNIILFHFIAILQCASSIIINNLMMLSKFIGDKTVCLSLVITSSWFVDHDPTHLLCLSDLMQNMGCFMPKRMCVS